MDSRLSVRCPPRPSAPSWPSSPCSPSPPPASRSACGAAPSRRRRPRPDAADRRRAPTATTPSRPSLVVGIGEQQAAMFSDPRFRDLRHRQGRASSSPTTRRAWTSSASSSTSGWPRRASAGVEPFITFGHSRVHPDKLPTVARVPRRRSARSARATPTCASTRRGTRSTTTASRRRDHPERAAEYYNVVKAECRGCLVRRGRRARPARHDALPQALPSARSTASRRSGACTTTPTSTASARAGCARCCAR